jgi:MoaA/NifB/PqqE/SkfB family radical SAM enzyme
MENKREPLCEMPWLALTITGQGDIKPCCQYKGSLGSIYAGTSIQEARNSPLALELKESLFNQELASPCNSCWQREKHIGESRRTWFKSKFSKYFPKEISPQGPSHSLVQMDLNLSNKCNLKCRMCGSWASHLWNKEDMALHQLDRKFKRENRPEKLKLFELDNSHIDEILPSLQNLRRIDFKGGEPMLAKSHVYLLQKLIELNLHQQIQLRYTTNGTVFIPAIVDLLKQFKTVVIIISIEAVGPLYSYIRGGRYSISDLLQNIKSYSELPNVTVSFNVAVQAYNALYLKDLWSLLNGMNLPKVSPKDAFKYTVVNEPEYLSPWVLPRALKQLAIERIREIPELTEFRQRLENSADNPQLWDLFCRFTTSVDGFREERILNVIPEMTPYFEKSSSAQNLSSIKV